MNHYGRDEKVKDMFMFAVTLPLAYVLLVVLFGI